MREILFRGKQEYDGKWVYGGIAKNEDGTVYILGDVCYMDGMEELWKDGHIVIPETVGQYAGITDKNGKKIFEGDIVYNGVFKSCVEFYDGRFTPFSGEHHTFFADECTIIGNIHDNPELMKGDNQ